ncbi:MAG TPA: hypothetical protein VGC42_28910 [Kofleriaceae bacterium]
MRTLIMTLALGCAACAGDTPKESHIDSGRTCAGDLYDPCLDEHNCPAGVCQNFAGDGFQVCTKSCTPGMDDACGVTRDGRAASCNAMGICKPPAANDCQIQ